MKKYRFHFFQSILCFATLIAFIACTAQPQSFSSALPKPPATPRIPVTDDYFRLKVTDHYRWMENVQDSAVIKWFEEQDAYAENIFDRITGRDELLAEYDALDSIKKDQVWNLRKDGDTYLYLRWNIKEDVTWLVRKKGENGKEEIMIDFKKMFPDAKGPGIFEYSPVSKYIVFYVFEGDHEATTLYFYDLPKRQFFSEQIRYSFGGYPNKIKFTQDGKGFFYFNVGLENNKSTWNNVMAKYHRIGEPATEDKIIVSATYPNLFPGYNGSYMNEMSVDPDYRYLILLCSKANSSFVFLANYSELNNEKINWVLLSKPEDKLDQPVIRKGIAYMISKKVPNQQLIKCRLGDLKNISVETLVPETSVKLDNLSATRDYLLLRYNNGINTWFKQYNTVTGKLEDAKINQQGFINTFQSLVSEKRNEIRLTVNAWNKPETPYLYDAEKKNLKVTSVKNSVIYPEENDLVVKEVEVTGHDGVMVPLSIIYHKDTRLDGNAICLLSAYGSYGAVLSPGFSTESLIYCKRGLIYAVAHVRGGGEKGEAWRLAGLKSNKPNTWKDFISCAEWLIKNKYTSPHHLIGEGGSAGGITVGRAITERPDLFAVGINRVGVTNMLRFEISSSFNNSEFGSTKDSSESRWLYEMDAVHHVKEGVSYPAILNTAGMTDGRVPVWQPGKFAAAMQYSTASNKPVLLQVYFQGGHFGELGANKNRNPANEMAFALWQAGHPDFKLKE
jgi:prolyl oligopeptidase